MNIYKRVRKVGKHLKIYAVNIETLKTMQEEIWSEWIHLLDCTRRERIVELRQRKDQIQSIGAGLLLRYSFLKEGYTTEQWGQIKIQRSSSGKPSVVQYPEFCYSLSHSGKWVICGTHSKALGADIQEMRPWKENVAKRFFAQEEYERILKTQEYEKQNMFYKLWTAKESYGKLTGDGIGKGISHYLTTADFERITDTEKRTTAKIRLYDTIPDYMVCICVKEEDVFPKEIEMVDWKKLLPRNYEDTE